MPMPMPNVVVTGVSTAATTYTVTATFHNACTDAVVNTWTAPVYTDSLLPYGFVAQGSQQQRDEASAAAKARNDRARALLLEHLSEEQADEYSTHDHFHVWTQDGKRQYRIYFGYSGNIMLIEDGQEAKEYCIHPNGFPSEDAMLAQKLLIETNEEEFLRIANETVMSNA